MLKYSVGIDVSKEHLQVCLMSMDMDQTTRVIRNRKLDNRLGGFKELHLMITNYLKDSSVPLQLVLEATGVYYEPCSLFLLEKGYSIAIVLPNHAKKYLQASGHKSKNDKIDAVGLAQLGAEKKLKPWQPHGLFFYELRALTRHREDLQNSLCSLRNQLHAQEHSGRPIAMIIKNLQEMMTMMESAVKKLDEQLEEHLRSDEKVWPRIEKIIPIKGVGLLTMATVLGETNGFALFENSRQLVSYAGYDVVENQSGNHVGRTRISKMGNSHLRRALYFPAQSAVSCKEEPFLSLYERTLKVHGIKMKSYVAVQKKILVLIYSLWKNGGVFDPEYQKKKAATIDEEGGAPSRVNLEEVENLNATEEEAIEPTTNPQQSSPDKRMKSLTLAPKKSSPLRATQGVQPTTNRCLHPLE